MIFSCCYPCGKAGAIQIRRYQGIAVDHYGGTLGALALNRSGFCNVWVADIAYGDARKQIAANSRR